MQALFHVGETDSQVKQVVPKRTEREIDESDSAFVVEHIALVCISVDYPVGLPILI
jgi:hypothetical protein